MHPVNDSLTVGGVVYHDDQGGYVDNVRGTQNLRESRRFRTADTVRLNGLAVGSRAGIQANSDLSGVTFLDADNSAIVEENFNDVTYSEADNRYLGDGVGLEVHADLLQKIEADGVFSDPSLDDYEIQRYEEDELDETLHNTNWTVEEIGGLDVIYTGAYTDRETDQIVDYTDYMFVGDYLPYYVCDGSVTYPSGAPAGTCNSPALYVDSLTETEISTHELRFATDVDKRVSATFGLLRRS